MIRQTDGLHKFRKELHPSVVEDIRSWNDHKELRQILSSLESHTSRKSFFDTYAEAIIARHLLSQKCELKFEVPTPQGKQSDFEVSIDDQVFYLHAKRVDTDSPRLKHLAVPSRLRVLERIPRPFVVQVRWHEGLTKDEMQQLVSQAAEFITHAKVGEEMRANDEDNRELGGVRILAPWEGSHVTVTIGLPSGFIDQAPRFRKLLHRAYQQFMPRATNVILIGSNHTDDSTDFETALLGSHIERWDAHPPQGRRVAHGRAADGFWHGGKYAESSCVGWFDFSPRLDELHCRLWMRPESPLDSRLQDLFLQLFDATRIDN